MEISPFESTWIRDIESHVPKRSEIKISWNKVGEWSWAVAEFENIAGAWFEERKESERKCPRLSCRAPGIFGFLAFFLFTSTRPWHKFNSFRPIGLGAVWKRRRFPWTNRLFSREECIGSLAAEVHKEICISNGRILACENFAFGWYYWSFLFCIYCIFSARFISEIFNLSFSLSDVEKVF